MFFGVQKLTSHHPFYSTIILGLIYSMGAFLASWFGMFLVVTLQAVCCAYVFSRICGYIVYKTNVKYARADLAFYAFAPMCWTYVQALVKDTLFFTAFSGFCLFFIMIIYGDGGKKEYFDLIVWGIVACLFRNEGVFIIQPALGIFGGLQVINKKSFREAFQPFVASFVVYMLLTFIATGIIGVRPLNQVEALAVPLNQVANYVKQYKDEMTSEEVDAIDGLILFDGIEERYNPELADSVKSYWRTEISGDDFRKFFNTYFSLLKKHPLPFVEGFINESFGYFDPFYFYTGMSSFQLYNKGSIAPDDENIVYCEYVVSKGARDLLAECMELWKKIPVLSFVVNPAAYTWLCLLIITQILRRKKYKLLTAMIAPVLCILICFASPVNGLLRYALPVMAVAPLYMFVVYPACNMMTWKGSAQLADQRDDCEGGL